MPSYDAALLGTALLLFACALTGCGRAHVSPAAPLPAVAPVATPHPPAWIVRYGPRDEVTTLAQIRVEFEHALIPLERIESPDVDAKLAYFTIEPQLSGRFRFLTPRLVGFQADAALPLATRVRVTVHAGLTDLSGDRLAHDVAWTFNTPALRIDLPHFDEPQTLGPSLSLMANAQLDQETLERHTTLTAVGGGAVPIKIMLDRSETPSPADAEASFDPSVLNWNYLVTPLRPLAKGTQYELAVGTGVLPMNGNMPLDTATSARFSTYAPLAFFGVSETVPKADGAFQRFADGDPVLGFNNAVTLASAQANITISPSPKPWAQLLDSEGDDARPALQTAALAPDTDYTITIAPGLTDVFGQTLGKTVTAHFRTGRLVPSFWAPSGFNIFPAGSDIALQVSSVNLPVPYFNAAYKKLMPTDLVAHDVTDPDTEAAFVGSGPGPKVSIKQRLDVPLETTMPISGLIGARTGMLAFDLHGDTGGFGNGADYTGVVQLTDLGVFAQWFPSSGLVRVHHLHDGSPSVGARVDIYLSPIDQKGTAPRVACASATTDRSGTAQFDAASLVTCMASRLLFVAPPQLLAVAREAADWSFAQTDEWSGAYGFGVFADWDDGKPQSRGLVYSDRSLYQLGETAWFTGAAYYLQRGVLHRDAGTRYRLTLEDADGNKSDLGVVTTDAFGAFSRRIVIGARQPLGDYAIHARSAAGVELDGDFRVAQFRPPNFKVTLALDKSIVSAGGGVDATSQSNYLFGPPVEGGKASYYVTRQETLFNPKGWDDFSFGRQWWWPEQPPAAESDVLQNTVTLAPDGAARQHIDVPADIPYPMTYEVDAQTTDVSNLSVADSKTFTALPDTRLIGLKSDWVGTAGAPLTAGLIVTDPNGTALRGVRIHVELQRVDYDRVEQIVAGGQTSVDASEYQTVASTDVSSAPLPISIALTPPSAGSYRLRANFWNAKSDATATDTSVWVTGQNPVFWMAENPDQLQVRLDRTSYRVGDWATALVESPYADATLYFSVIRSSQLYAVTRSVHGGAPSIRFRVTAGMLPNAAVEALLVRKGPLPTGAQADPKQRLSLVGFAPFAVRHDDRDLELTIVPAHASLSPRAVQHVTFEVRDAAGRPAPAQLTVAVANEAVLQLSGYRLPALGDVVYAEQAIATRFADNRPNVVLRQPPSPIEKGWGFGGGLSAAAASTIVRNNFQPLAYFNGSVRTGADGRAAVDFSLPDDLTTWRVMAVATASTPRDSSAYRFGTADATFVTTTPLATNPLMPQFVRPGDTFQAGASITNVAAAKGTVAVSASSSGAVRFDVDGKPATTAGAQAQLTSGTQAVRFTLTAGAGDVAGLRVRTSGAGMTDAFSVSIPVVAQQYVEQVVDSGVTSDRADIALSIAPDARTDVGGLDVTLASTLLPEIVEPAREQIATDCWPFLEPAASQLAIAADVMQLERTYGRVSAGFSPARTAATDLSLLQRLQQRDGGFAPWPGVKDDDYYDSAYAAESLAAARSAGIAVDGSMVSSVASYLRAELADPTRDDRYCDGRCAARKRLYALEALAALGDARTDFLSDIYGERDELAVAERIRLARYLLRFAGWRAQGHEMAVKFRESVYETGRTATVNIQNERWWYDSPTVDQALMLRLMIADGQNAEFIDRMVEGLLALRRHGTWRFPYEDASALGALIEYGALQPAPPAFEASASLAGRAIADVRFNGYADPTHTAHVAPSTLSPGRQMLSLRSSGGALHYFTAYAYAPAGGVRGTIAGLRVIRYVRRAGDPTVLWQSGLALPSGPLRLETGQVFDIEVEVIADHPVDQVLITDPLPAGFEAVDAAFKTSTGFFENATDSWRIDYQQIYRDRVIAFGDHFDAGDYVFHYIVRSVTPGTFSWPGAEAHLEYAPEIFGRTASATLELH